MKNKKKIRGAIAALLLVIQLPYLTTTASGDEPEFEIKMAVAALPPGGYVDTRATSDPSDDIVYPESTDWVDATENALESAWGGFVSNVGEGYSAFEILNMAEFVPVSKIIRTVDFEAENGSYAPGSGNYNWEMHPICRIESKSGHTFLPRQVKEENFLYCHLGTDDESLHHYTTLYRTNPEYSILVADWGADKEPWTEDDIKVENFMTPLVGMAWVAHGVFKIPFAGDSPQGRIDHCHDWIQTHGLTYKPIITIEADDEFLAQKSGLYHLDNLDGLGFTNNGTITSETSPGDVTISFTPVSTSSRYRYVIQGSTDLKDWSTIHVSVDGPFAGNLEYTFDQADHKRYFFRANILPRVVN